MLIPFSKIIKDYNIHPKGVLHVGASTGQECETYYANGVEQTIWVEGNPDIFVKLCDHIGNYPNVQAYNILVDEHGGREVDFNISNNDGESSSIHKFGTHKKLHPTVKFIEVKRLKTTRIDEIIKGLTGFDFLNIDLQGSELSALRSMGTLLDGFKYAYLEVNMTEVYQGIPLFSEVAKFMRSNGFELIETKWVTNGMNEKEWGDSLWFRKNIA